ncbi:hypothetical protein BDF14DRAFT_1874709 [Spinellus fusiger]|nr:hypothetical protein BDF14DRAFT_1874709 [Spinellus fusiger]
MHFGLLSHDALAFDPLKPILLRGLPTDDSTSLFMNNVVLTLTKAKKISRITVQLKSVCNTNWPEGIGARGTRLYHKKILGEQTSMAETIEDDHGQVTHTIEAHVVGPGMALLNHWQTSKPVLVLRTYMSNSLLTNNSLQDLSHTFEKRLDIADIQAVVETRAFSSGDILHLKLVIQPHQKYVRLDHIKLSIEETRRYAVPEMHALRTDTDHFKLAYVQAVRLLEDESTAIETDELAPVFMRQGHGLDVSNTLAYRITLSTPSCARNIRHTTHFKDILFRHHLNIRIILSHCQGTVSAPLSRMPSSSHLPSLAAEAFNSHSNSNSNVASPPLSPSPSTTPNPSSPSLSTTLPINAQHPMWHSMFAKLRKPRQEKEAEWQNRRIRNIHFGTSATVFDCRLKEDYGQLPSYADLGPLPYVPLENKGSGSSPPTTDPATLTLSSSSTPTFSPSTVLSFPLTHSSSTPTSPTPEILPTPGVYLCPCYHRYQEQLRLASELPVLHSPTQVSPELPLATIPSKPPPDYVESYVSNHLP